MWYVQYHINEMVKMTRIVYTGFNDTQLLKHDNDPIRFRPITWAYKHTFSS